MSGNYRISDCGDSTQQIVDALEAAWNNIVQVTSMNVEAATASTGPIKSVDYALEAFFSGVSPANVQRLLLTLKDGDKVGGPPAQYPSLQCVQEGQPWGLSEHVRRCTSNTWIFGFVSDEIVYICPQFFNLPPFVEGTKNCPTIAYGGGLFQGDEDLFVLYQPFTLINLLADLYIGPSSFPRARGLWPMDLEWNVCANLEYGDAQNNPKNYQLFIA
ncbi:hypothetical protein MMC06_005252, partial [Schaereria dolodes]|nr:hypothetical protein [Schaereria dolodes]